MAKKRRTSKMPAGLRRYWNKKQGGKSVSKKRKGHSVAKKKRKSSSRGRRRKSVRRRRSGGGGGGSILPMIGAPSREKAMDIVGAGVYGYLEVKAKADPENFMNKIPRPVAQIGYSGGTALACWIAAKFAPPSVGKYLRHLGNGAASVALYQMGKRQAAGGQLAFASADAIEGIPTYGVEGDFIDGETLGALAAEGEYVGAEFDEDGMVAGDEELAVLGVE